MFRLIKKLFIRLCPTHLLSHATDVLYGMRMIWYKTIMFLFFKKMTMYCPCCETKCRAFATGNYRDYPKTFNPSRYECTRQDVLCPVCRSLPRHRILALWLEKHLEHLRTADILYFSPNRSEKIWLKKKKISCMTADLYAKADIKIDIQQTGLPDESYDVIVCNHVLEHVDNFRIALNEVYRILRTNGSFICSFPMDPKIEYLDEDPSVRTGEERIIRFGQKDHKRVFGMKAERFLEETGFIVKKIDGKYYPEEILPVVGPADYDINLLFHCIKMQQLIPMQKNTQSFQQLIQLIKL